MKAITIEPWLARTGHSWLAHLVTRRALARQPDDVKVAIQFAEV